MLRIDKEIIRGPMTNRIETNVQSIKITTELVGGDAPASWH